jgi:hypothetical protein
MGVYSISRPTTLATSCSYNKLCRDLGQHVPGRCGFPKVVRPAPLDSTTAITNGIIIHDLGPKRPLIFAKFSLMVLVYARAPICGGVTKHSWNAKYRFPTLFGCLVSTLLAAKRGVNKYIL